MAKALSERAQIPKRRLYSMAEAAELLSVRRQYIYTLAYRGDLPTVKLGRRRLVPAESLEAFIAQLVDAS